jgi:hypothetical protein
MKFSWAMILSVSMILVKSVWAGCGPPECQFQDGGNSPVPLSTIVNCDKACATCGAGQTCYCDPGSGYSCGASTLVFINGDDGVPVYRGSAADPYHLTGAQ